MANIVNVGCGGIQNVVKADSIGKKADKYSLNTTQRLFFIEDQIFVIKIFIMKSLMREILVVVVWSGIPNRSGLAQIKTRGEGLSFYHPGMLHCPD